MITKNFKQLNKLILEKTAINTGLLPVSDTTGTTYYLSPAFTTSVFPYTQNHTIALNSLNAGISLGTGTTPATDLDYVMEAAITSGIQTWLYVATDVDNGDPIVTFEIIVKNIQSSAITISELGYKQPLYAATTLKGTNAAARVCLLDHTILDEPVTLQPDEYVLIKYSLTTTDN